MKERCAYASDLVADLLAKAAAGRLLRDARDWMTKSWRTEAQREQGQALNRSKGPATSLLAYELESEDDMTVLFTFGAFLLGGCTFILRELRRAPHGRETARGFDFAATPALKLKDVPQVRGKHTSPCTVVRSSSREYTAAKYKIHFSKI